MPQAKIDQPSRVTLPRRVLYGLMKLLEAEYATRGEDDIRFALYATEKLGHQVNTRHVLNARTELEIPNTRTLAAAKKPKRERGTILARLADLEARVAKLEKEWNV